MMGDVPIVFLALMMGLVTFPTRIAPFLLPIDRMPDRLARSVRLMGPASVAAVAAVTVSESMSTVGSAGELTAVLPATAVCVGLVAMRRNLALGLLGAIVVASLVTFFVR